ncbi:MAG: flavin reductase family protein [Chloroflexi bacterium]|nr:flavin reductase family protein [Chloroflexota bacterium]
MPVEREQFFRLMASFTSGVTVITSRDVDGIMRGFTASAFCSLSLEPRMCMIGVDLRSESLPAIERDGGFVVNILASDQEEISRRFASKALNKYEGLSHRLGRTTGAPILDGVLCWIECRVREILPGGDHAILVGEIQDGDARDGEPLVYFRGQYRELA